MKTNTEAAAVTAPKLEIRNLKTCRGTDGPAWSCTLYVDGVKAAEVTESGRGGCHDYYFFDTKGPNGYVPSKIEARLNEWVKTLPRLPFGEDLGGGDYEQDLDHVVSGLADDYENDKRMQRFCKKGIVFRKAGDPDGIYTTKVAYTAANVAACRAKHGADVEIINEKYGPPADVKGAK